MSNQYIQRVLTRQFLGTSSLGDLLSSQLDATAYNNPGSKIFVQDVSGNMTSFVYVYTAGLTAVVAGVPMYWYDQTRCNATDTVTSAVTYAASSDSAIQSAAGVAISIPTTTTPYCWLSCGGYMTGLPTPTSCTVGDLLLLSNSASVAPSNDAWFRVAKGTAAATAEAVTTLYACVTSVISTASVAALILGTVGMP